MILRAIAIIAIIFGGLVSLGNWWILYKSWRTKHFVSTIPLIGASFLYLGLCHFDITRPYAWLSIIADYGTIVLIYSIPSLAKQFWNASSYNLIRKYIGNSHEKIYILKLYKKGIFTLKSNTDLHKINKNYGARTGFELTGKWYESDDTITLTDYANNRITIMNKKNDKYLSTESNYLKNQKHPYNSLDAIEFELQKVRQTSPTKTS